MKPLLILLVIVIIAGAAGYWFFSNNPDEWQQVLVDFGLQDIEALQTEDQKQEVPLTASGFIEAKEVPISSEIGGRIERLLVDNGDQVSAAQPIANIESSLLGAQKQKIEAQISLADAQIDQIKAGVPAEMIAVAEAQISLAETARDAAEQDVQDAMLLRDTPQQLDAEIDAARSEVQIARLKMQQAEYLRDVNDLQEDIAKEYWDLVHAYPIGDGNQVSADWNLASMGVWQGYLSWEAAKVVYNSAIRKLNTLQEVREEPVDAELLVSQAEADYRAKVAAVDVAKADLQQLMAPVPQSQINVLEANRDQAQTQWLTLLAQLEKYVLTSPMNGVVINKLAHQGEIIMPGIPLLTVANLDEVTLTVFVSDVDYGRIQNGQAVEVSVDSFPGEVFPGVITRISDQAEFTPRNVQTQEERVSLVYAIKITIPNENQRLNPGVPADVVFVEAIPR